MKKFIFLAVLGLFLTNLAMAEEYKLYSPTAYAGKTASDGTWEIDPCDASQDEQ
ncbi:MAG: hypothetical protein WCG05_03650 [Alphaproteobacteria bacterium]